MLLAETQVCGRFSPWSDAFPNSETAVARQDTCDRVLYYFSNYLYCTILPLLPCITKSLPWVAECFKGAVTCMASVDIACGGYIRKMDQ